MIRAFIAMEIPDDIRSAISDAQARLKRAHTGVKISWARIDGIHLTLQFLGYVEESAISKISDALGSVAARHAAFDLPMRGAGAFPNERSPRVLWVGCDDSVCNLKRLAADVQSAMEPLGFEPEHREFSAHLTLGRIKIPRHDAALTRALDSIKTQEFGTMRVKGIHLVQSQLHPEGSVYTRLSSHQLKDL